MTTSRGTREENVDRNKKRLRRSRNKVKERNSLDLDTPKNNVKFPATRTTAGSLPEPNEKA